MLKEAFLWYVALEIVNKRALDPVAVLMKECLVKRLQNYYAVDRQHFPGETLPYGTEHNLQINKRHFVGHYHAPFNLQLDS